MTCDCQAPGKPHGTGTCACTGTLHNTDPAHTVLVNPKLYVDWWGWGTPPNDPAGIIPGLKDFLQYIGGSRWLNIVTQYYQEFAPCGNPRDLWAGEWFDNTNPLPAGTNGQACTQDSNCLTSCVDNLCAGGQACTQDIDCPRPACCVNNQCPDGETACTVDSNCTGCRCNFSSGKCWPTQNQWYAEVNAAVQHFNPVDDGIVFIPTPPAIASLGFWDHDSAPRSGHPAITFIRAPYSATLVTPTALHEIAETITDPRARFDGGGPQWIDDCGCELADMCGGDGSTRSVGVSPTSNYDVVDLWSNAANLNAGACVYAYQTHEDYYFKGITGTLRHTTCLTCGTPFDDYGKPPGVTLNSTPGAVSWRNGRQDAFFYGSDGNVWQWRQEPGVAPGWSVGWGHPTGTLKYGPDAFSLRPRHEDVVVVSQNTSGLKQFWAKAYMNTTWGIWRNLGAPPTSAIGSRPGTASWGPNRFDIFFLSTESPPHVRHAYSLDGTNIAGWDDWTYPPGVTLSTAGIDAASWGDQNVHVVVLGTDGNIWQRGYDHGLGNWFSWGNPGSSFTYPGGAVGLGDLRLDVAADRTQGVAVQAYRRVWDWGGFPTWASDSQFENGIIDISAW